MVTYLERLTEAVDRSLLAGLDPARGTLDAAMHYALSQHGKRLRPLLFLSFLDAHEILGLDYVDIAAAIEIIHTYSLIHDDMPCMDDDDMRRGHPTVHRQFNEATALLAGDTLLTLAFERIVTAPLTAEKTRDIMRVITHGIGREGMAGGQVLDLEFSGDRKRIEEIHRKKTAELIRATLLSAACIVEYTCEKKEILSRAGLEIGIAFQLADDLLDVAGDEREAGKKLRKDSENRSPNAALHWGMERVRERIDEGYRISRECIDRLGISFLPFLELLDKMVHRSR